MYTLYNAIYTVYNVHSVHIGVEFSLVKNVNYLYIEYFQFKIMLKIYGMYNVHCILYSVHTVYYVLIPYRVSRFPCKFNGYAGVFDSVHYILYTLYNVHSLLYNIH